MPPSSRSLAPDTATSPEPQVINSRSMGEMYESSRLILPNSHGYFWDAEELRHQEHLHRVSHAQHLYRHRYDSNEADRMYKSFMKEQNQWIVEQEQIKEMESKLSMRAYQQRASRWEEEWRRLEEERTVEGTSKIMDTAQFKPVPQQESLRDILPEGNNRDDLSDLVMTPQTISSLQLPDPLLSIYGPSKFVSSNDLQQVDGAQPSKHHSHNQTRQNLQIPKPDIQPDYNPLGCMDFVPRVPKTRPVRTSQPRLYSNPHEICRLSGTPKKSRDLYLQPTPTEIFKNISVEVSETESPHLSPNPSSYDAFPEISSQAQSQQEQYGGPPLATSEVFRVIDHKPWKNHNFLYLILWKPQNSDGPTELWAKASDFLGSGKKVILEEYHFRHNLGPVRWPRDPRRQWRSSTSLGVQELKSALDERKQMLLDRGASELDASCEMNKERWKMRDDWQRAGRGWGSALMIVKDRKTAWSMEDPKTGEVRVTSAADVEDAPHPGKTSEENSSNHISMMQAAGMIDLDMSQAPPKLKLFHPYPLNANPLPLSKKAIDQLPSTSNRKSNISDLKRSKTAAADKRRSEFAITSEDEREWKDHFMSESIGSRLSRIKTKSSGLSRVKSTLHNLPNGVNLELVRASTLPELHERIVNFQPVPKKRLQEAVKPPEPMPPKSPSSILSEAQNHLKTQRKNLLSRMLSHGPFRRESHRQSRPTHQTSNPNDSNPQLVEGSQPILLFGTATEPLGDSLNQDLRNQPEQIATPRSSSYISFDGANSTLKIPVKESWTKTIWDRFSHFLVASSRASLNGKKRRQTKAPTTAYTPKSPIREAQVSSPLAHDEIQAQSNPVEVRTPSSRAGVVSDIKTIKKVISESPQQIKAQPVKIQRVQQQRDPIHEARLSTPKPTAMETQASRTASWAASLSPMMRKSKSEEPRVKWASPFTDGEDMIAEITFTPSRTGIETVPETTDLSQISLEISSGASMLPKKPHLTTTLRKEDEGKGKAVSEFHTPTLSQTESLTRTHSQQQYLLDREADKKARRDRNILRTKYKNRKMKEKADQKAEQFKRLNILHSKKACPLGKWSKRDQVELELLRMKLGLRGAKNSWKRNDLRRLGMAELQELRESLLPAARITSNQPKGQSPV